MGKDKETSAELITIRQLPIIQQELQAVKARWEKIAEDAKSLVCTEETVQTLKAMRAEMRKEYTEVDDQRKAVKAKFMEPWDAVESAFRSCIKDAFTEADESLKGTIGAFEDELKAKCRQDLQEYFDELCAMEKIDFLTLDQAMTIGKVKISLADAKRSDPRKLKDAVAAVVCGIAENLDRIREMDDRAEIMAEYKTCLDLGKAVAKVQGWKRKVQEEKEAAERREAEREREAEQIAKVEAVAPPEETSAPEPEEKVWPVFRFTVFNCTRKQLIGIREYLKQEGIEYGK